MPIQPIDFAADDSVAGFRLQRLEVFNWGTFHRHVWRIEPDGHNALLTGDIGSGKSTLVDALTTLLVPHQWIIYNKAAGAEGKERTLYSYIRGEYKTAKDELTQAAKAVALRDDNSYSVLLAHFYNQGFAQHVTLAQVFWLKDHQRNPERFFLVAQTPLSIAQHFSHFGSDILDLKKRLRRTRHVEVLDTFKEYGNRFRHLFGIHTEQALQLFYQTVSMKSVGNLTEFVRNHMLERTAVDNRIDELRRNFDNLNRAHEAVLKAKRQIEALEPLVADGEHYQELEVDIAGLRGCREALGGYFAAHKVRLLGTRIAQLGLTLAKTNAKLEQLEQQIAALQGEEATLKASIDDHGGRRLRQIEQDIARLAEERDRRLKLHQTYRGYAEQLALAVAVDEEAFYRNRAQAENLQKEIEHRLQALQQQQVDARIAIREAHDQHAALQAEIASLRSRRSNIPLRNLEIRRAMAEILGLDEEELPFVGELLQVDEAERAWEGAIERLLHNFGLSLLVPEARYAQVSHYVDRTHLKGRLVYYRVREAGQTRPAPVADPHALIGKLRIKPDSAFYTWLEAELSNHFDYRCCDSLAEFRRQPKAITQNGQIKSAGQRHEKDDRRSLHDRSHYVLGWSNEDKIKVLEAKLKQLQRQAQVMADQAAALLKQQQHSTEQLYCIRDLLKIERFVELAWQPVAAQIQRLEEERQALEQSSDILHTLNQQLAQVRQARSDKEAARSKLIEQRGDLRRQHQDRQGELSEARVLMEGLPREAQALFPRLDGFMVQVLADKTLSLQNLDKSHTEVREAVQRQIDNHEGRSKRLAERIARQMQAYKNAYPAETAEVDASLAALNDYAGMLRALQTEDLPRHEARFKQMLNEKTIQHVALFQSQLDKERHQIQEKIEAINHSLRAIEYNPGTFIKLVMDKAQDPEIRTFQQDLKQCLAHSLDEGEIYNEAKFLQVKALVERFNGRQGLVDLDRAWTRKVTDVRNWFNFSASERWREDDSEKEFYSDSAGKSGGQKEKLAYTILASALAYQFGLEWGVTQSRSFRFVAIDEAFGRGSDESTRYGLELFKKLNLQLLIVTPLQKIHIIEDYIRSVHFVHNESGSHSMVRNLTIAEYQAQKQRYQANAG